jgi:hypothetical protein
MAIASQTSVDRSPTLTGLSTRSGALALIEPRIPTSQPALGARQDR